MITHVLHCPYCQGIDIVRHGQSPAGKQRDRCCECWEGCGRTCLLDSSDAGQSPEVKQQRIDMAMHASGMRETARVWHISPTTVSNERKKKNLVGKDKTQKIENTHLNLRTRIKRLVHRTMCFSKTARMHDLVIGLCVHR